jgi:hypothetical protein
MAIDPRGDNLAGIAQHWRCCCLRNEPPDAHDVADDAQDNQYGAEELERFKHQQPGVLIRSSQPQGYIEGKNSQNYDRCQCFQPVSNFFSGRHWLPLGLRMVLWIVMQSIFKSGYHRTLPDVGAEMSTLTLCCRAAWSSRSRPAIGWAPRI